MDRAVTLYLIADTKEELKDKLTELRCLFVYNQLSINGYVLERLEDDGIIEWSKHYSVKVILVLSTMTSTCNSVMQICGYNQHTISPSLIDVTLEVQYDYRPDSQRVTIHCDENTYRI